MYFKFDNLFFDENGTRSGGRNFFSLVNNSCIAILNARKMIAIVFMVSSLFWKHEQFFQIVTYAICAIKSAVDTAE